MSLTDNTGDIPAAAKDFRSLEFIRSCSESAIVLGTRRGVYAARLSAMTDWAQVGSDLPNAYVCDMDYDHPTICSWSAPLAAGCAGCRVFTPRKETS